MTRFIAVFTLVPLVACSADSTADGDSGPGAGMDGAVSGGNDGLVSGADGSAGGPDGSTSGFDGSMSGVDGSTSGGTDGGRTTVFDAGPAMGTPSGDPLCGGRYCECQDGIDNDMDGSFDGFDAECTGPTDDDEGSFATGQPGDNIDFCQDCFFDGDSGQGNDGCQYHSDCITTGMAPAMGGGGCFNCDVSTRCLDTCRPSTPNGCDCFGCCTVFQDDGSSVDVFLAATCDFDNLSDTTACPRCMKSTTCENPCGECELCSGKTLADLPASCFVTPDAGTPSLDAGMSGTDAGAGTDAGQPPMLPTCDGGEQPCSPEIGCPAGFFCQQGCCLPSLI